MSIVDIKILAAMMLATVGVVTTAVSSTSIVANAQGVDRPDLIPRYGPFVNEQLFEFCLAGLSDLDIVADPEGFCAELAR